MTTAYCIDVSGSMMSEQIRAAFDFVAMGIEPGDHIIVFDIKAVAVSLNWIRKSPDDYRVGSGGTDAKECIALANKLGCYSKVLISDGYLVAEDLMMFNKFIDVTKLETK